MIKMNPLKFLIILIISFFVILLVTGIIVYNSVSYGLPSFEQLENPKQDMATRVMSADGVLLDHFYWQRRVSLSFDSIPKAFINALIATEDRNFYSHWGVHTQRIFNAFLKNIFAFRIKEGGSTITMQLSCNLFFSRENTLSRKLKEVLTSIEIEKNFTKNEILELYCNTVGFGRGTYGLQVASQVYFNKIPMELTTSECAYLVGLLKAPEHYNGLLDYEKAIERRNLVLRLMIAQGYLTEEQYQTAIAEPISLSRASITRRASSLLAPHFVEWIRQQLRNDALIRNYDLYRDGLLITTTLNSKIQQYAKEAVEEHLNEYQKIFNRSWNWNNNQRLLDSLIKKAIESYPSYSASTPEQKRELEKQLKKDKRFIDSVKNAATTVQVGLVVLDPLTGEVLALVGASPKFMEENNDAKYSLNHVTQIKRQPGSAFKPFVYASALEKGLTPSSQVECGPFTYINPVTGEAWSPRGSADCEPGQSMTLSRALAASVNTVSARLITGITTPDNVISLASKMGIKSKLRSYPALSLGAGGEVTPLEMANGFGTIVNDGIWVEPYSYRRIEDQFGNILREIKKSTGYRDALKPEIAHDMISMMQGVVDAGTGREIRKYFVNCDAAGKTGTTNDYADAWFVGFTPQLVAAVWVGFDDRRITFTGGYGYAAKAAAPVWGRLMAKIYNDKTLPYKQRKFSYSKADSSVIKESITKQADVNE